MEFKQESTPSLWSKMLEDQLSSKRDRVANVFVFGDPSSGKKRMLDGLKKYTSLDSQEAKRLNEDSPIKELEKVYIMDFKFIHLRQLIEDEVQEIGKINFFIYNRKYSFIGELLTRDMMQNMLLVFVVDLESPETIEESLNSWYEYAISNIGPFLSSFEPEQLSELSASYNNVLKRFREFGRVNPEAAKKTGKVEGIAEENEEDDKDSVEEAQNLPKADHPKPAQEGEESRPPAEEAPKQQPAPAEALQIPMIIVGAKADKIEESQNNALRDFVEFTLQKLTKKLHATLFTISAFKDWNMDLISQFILFTIFNKMPENFSSIVESTDLKRTFIRGEDIDLDDTIKRYPGVKTFVFPKKKEADSGINGNSGVDIKNINDFLTDVKNGKFSHSEETESSLFVSMAVPPGFGTSNTQLPAMEKSNLFAKQKEKIGNLLKQNG